MDCKRLFDLLSIWTRNQLGNIFINIFIGLLHCVRAFHTIQPKDRHIFTQWPSVPSTIYVLSLITLACGYRPRFKQPECCVLAGALFGITVTFYVFFYEYVVLNSWLYIMKFLYYMSKLLPECAESERYVVAYWHWCLVAITAFCYMIEMTDAVSKLRKALYSDDGLVGAKKEKSLLDKDAKERFEGFDEKTMKLRAYALAKLVVADKKWPDTDTEVGTDSEIDRDSSDEINVDVSADNLSKLPDQVVQTSHVEQIGTNNADNLNANMCVYADSGQ